MNEMMEALTIREKKKQQLESSKLLIFTVDQPGLEPGTSRL